jgi:hypothetical protein
MVAPFTWNRYPGQPRRFATLTADELTERLRKADDPELLPDMLAFGDRMLDEQVGRTASIESKATTILGYSTALFGFLLFALGGKEITPLDRALVSVAALLAFGATVSAYLALRVRDWEWFTAHTWIPDANLLAGLEHLRRHYIQWTYRVLRSAEGENRVKARAVSCGQNLLCLV